MLRVAFARILDFEELVKLEANPEPAITVDGMIYMDCAPNPKKEIGRKLFPCYITGIGKNKEGEVEALKIGLIQWRSGIPQVLLVKVGRKAVEKGDKIRFWDLPPTVRLLDEHPFPDVPEPNESEEKKK